MSAKEPVRDYYVEAVIDYFFPQGLSTNVEDAIASGRARLVTGRDASGEPIYAEPTAAE